MKLGREGIVVETVDALNSIDMMKSDYLLFEILLIVIL